MDFKSILARLTNQTGQLSQRAAAFIENLLSGTSWFFVERDKIVLTLKFLISYVAGAIESQLGAEVILIILLLSRLEDFVGGEQQMKR